MFCQLTVALTRQLNTRVMVATSWTRVMLNVPVKVMEVGVVMLRNVVSYQPAGAPLSVGDVLHSTSENVLCDRSTHRWYVDHTQ